MRVILLKEVENLGKKYEIKEVKDGYARNFLIPKNLVKPATKENIRWLENQKTIEEKRAEEELKKIQETVTKIDGLELTIPVKVTEEGKVFGSVNVLKIVDKLQEAGFDIKKTQVEFGSSIKELGEWPVKISFPHGLEAEITVMVVEKKEE